MTEMLYKIVYFIARVHSGILEWNDAYEAHFSDKELHFLVIGLLGMALVFFIQPIFKWLAKQNHVLVITWIYVFTLIIVLTFAIEIGQKLTGTGVMEFADIMFGVEGFLAMFLVYALIRAVIIGIYRLIQDSKKSKNKDED